MRFVITLLALIAWCDASQAQVKLDAPRNAKAGDLVVVKYDLGEKLQGDGLRLEWIIEGNARQLASNSGLALVPMRPGKLGVVLIVVTDEVIDYRRAEIQVGGKSPGKPSQVVDELTPTRRAKPKPKKKPQAPVETTLTMYSSDSCVHCDRFTRDVAPSLTVELEVIKSRSRSNGLPLRVYPSFEIRQGDKVTFLEGFKTLDQINQAMNR